MFCTNEECPDFKIIGAPVEYVDGISICPACGARLVTELPPQTPPPIDHLPEELEGSPVIVATYNLKQDADLAVSYLVACGIRAIETSDDCGGVDPALRFSNRTSVLVAEDQAEEALQLLKDQKPNA